MLMKPFKQVLINIIWREILVVKGSDSHVVDHCFQLVAAEQYIVIIFRP